MMEKTEARYGDKSCGCSIIIEAGSDVEKVNALLHEFAPYILGRMGIPYRRRAINIISVAMEAPQDAVNTLTGKLGRLPGVSAKTMYSGKIYADRAGFDGIPLVVENNGKLPMISFMREGAEYAADATTEP